MNEPNSQVKIGRFIYKHRGIIFGFLIVLALMSFEIFNYSTTEYALADFLGNLGFVNIRWSVILAIAFCCIDFAGLARLFTPEQGKNESKEIWYLFGAWLIAATMNAMLTWWTISLSIVNHANAVNQIIDRSTLVKIVPIFIAVMVWLIRVLIIGTFAVAGDRLFATKEVLDTNMTAAMRRQIKRSQGISAKRPKSRKNLFPFLRKWKLTA